MTAPTCPSSEDLAAFGEWRLSPEDEERVRLHVFSCNECWEIAMSYEPIEAPE